MLLIRKVTFVWIRLQWKPENYLNSLDFVFYIIFISDSKNIDIYKYHSCTHKIRAEFFVITIYTPNLCNYCKGMTKLAF